jgi:hypothetical protein
MDGPVLVYLPCSVTGWEHPGEPGFSGFQSTVAIGQWPLAVGAQRSILHEQNTNIPGVLGNPYRLEVYCTRGTAQAPGRSQPPLKVTREAVP